MISKQLPALQPFQINTEKWAAVLGFLMLFTSTHVAAVGQHAMVFPEGGGADVVKPSKPSKPENTKSTNENQEANAEPLRRSSNSATQLFNQSITSNEMRIKEEQNKELSSQADRYTILNQSDALACKAEIDEFFQRMSKSGGYVACFQVEDCYKPNSKPSFMTIEEMKKLGSISWFIKGNERCSDNWAPCYGLHLFSEKNLDLVKYLAEQQASPSDTGPDGQPSTNAVNKCLARKWLSKRDGGGNQSVYGQANAIAARSGGGTDTTAVE